MRGLAQTVELLASFEKRWRGRVVAQYRQKQAITLEECDRIIGRIRAKCEETGMPAAIAVVDEAGNLKAFARTDGADSPMSVQAAIEKAVLALNARASIRDFWQMVQDDDILRATTLSGVLAMPGGLPIMADDPAPVGAIGVAGLGHYSDDEILAKAGLSET
jgi:uncharacterized protein GlcG (DUF336 family)